jgi:hypothetical protein
MSNFMLSGQISLKYANLMSLDVFVMRTNFLYQVHQQRHAPLPLLFLASSPCVTGFI